MHYQRRIYSWLVRGTFLVQGYAIIDMLIGNSQENVGNVHDAVHTFESMLPYISTVQSTSASSAEHRFWTERLLARHCLLASRGVKSKAETSRQNLSPESILAPFRAWADFWGSGLSGDSGKLEGQDATEGISRRWIWQSYYNTLSILLQQGLSYPSPSEKPSAIERRVSAYDNKFLANPKLQQITELKKVEAIYEGLLLKEVKFPKANEASSEVESWVEQVTANWRVYSGSTWRDDDVGEGGKEALSRNVLAVCKSVILFFPRKRADAIGGIDTDLSFGTDSLSFSYKELSLDSGTATAVHCSCFIG